MKTYLLTDLFNKLKALDGLTYKNYKKIKGMFKSQNWNLIIDTAQADPSSPPSHLRIQVPNMLNGFPAIYLDDLDSKIPLSDFILRKFNLLLKKFSHHSGSGKSGIFYTDTPGPQILERSSIYFSKKYIELRFRYGLPAKGNRIDSKAMLKTLELGITGIVSKILTYSAYNTDELSKYINFYKQQNCLRNKLKEKNIIAFIPDGAILPRESGQSFLPLKDAIPFKSPENMKQTFTLSPNNKITGMAIPRGVTFITGGGFHGKSTLLNAIKYGIYNHIEGDGREFVVSNISTFKINAEDKRYASGINISPYIHNLPLEKSSTHFSSKQCSGSTSQAATVIESIRMGAKSLLFDEDTSATNFLICDKGMKEIIGEKDKTITPYLESARSLLKKHGVSTIIVAGSFSPSLITADIILKMSNYQVYDITSFAKDIINSSNSSNINEENFNSQALESSRIIDTSKFRINKRTRPFKTKLLTKDKIMIDTTVIDFHDNEQLIDITQTKTLLELLIKFEELIFKKRISCENAVTQLFLNLEEIESISQNRSGFTMVRPIDFAHLINRFRFLNIISPQTK